MSEPVLAVLVGFLFAYYARFFWVYVIRPEYQRYPLRRMTRFERWLQRQRHKYAQYDMERLAQVSLVCIVILSGIWSLIFK